MSGENKPEDDPNSVGHLNKNEMAMIIIGAVIVLIVGTYSAVVIIGIQNSASEITITGEVDLGLFSGVVFTIAGAGILYLGITQGGKMVSIAGIIGEKSGLRRQGVEDESGEGGRQGTLEGIQARLEWYDKDIEGHEKNIKKWSELKEKLTDASMKAYIDAVILEEKQDIVDTQKDKQVQLDRLERYKNSGHW